MPLVEGVILLICRFIMKPRSLGRYITLRWCVPMAEGVCGNSRKPVRREQK